MTKRPPRGSWIRGAGLGAIAVTAVGLTAFEAQAGFTTYGLSGNSGTFSVACSGPGDGGLPNAGNFDNRNFFGTGADCTANPLTPSASSTYARGNASASSNGTAVLGELKGKATMTAGGQVSSDPDHTPFPAGFIDLGWMDTMVINNGPATGQLATATVKVDVTGILNATGVNVTSLLQLVVTSEVAGLHLPSYQIQSANSIPETLVISDMLMLPLKFVVGTPAQFLVRAQGRAMTSSQTSGGNNSSDVDFLTTLTWGGIESVTLNNGQQLSSFTATGLDSGIDWAKPFQAPVVAVPAPATLPLFAIGLALLALVGWRSGRAAG